MLKKAVFIYALPVVGLLFVVATGLAQASIALDPTRPLPDTENVSVPSVGDLGAFQFGGRTEGVSNRFEIIDSRYLNIALQSSELIDARIQSIRNMILMKMKPVSAVPKVQITISNLEPLTTYYKYEDSYRNLTVFISDATGSYTYVQDLTRPHFVFIQTRKSTKFLNDGPNGGDCIEIGIWDGVTKTCTLTTDLNETIEIESDGITLDGNGRTVTGFDTGQGIFLNQRSGVMIKNIEIQNFDLGISLNTSSANTITNVAAANNWIGIALGFASFNNSVVSNTVSNNEEAGISLHNSGNNIIDQNDISSNGRNGIVLGSVSSNNTVTDNSAVNNGIGILVDGASNILSGNTASHNSSYGIILVNAPTNTLKDNIIQADDIGIVIANNSDDNTVHKNIIIASVRYGMIISGSFNNEIYNNNFIDNAVQADVRDGSTGNVFSLALPIGGNHWSGYNRPSQDCDDLDSNYLCDSSYVFGGSQDDLSWIFPNAWSDMTPLYTQVSSSYNYPINPDDQWADEDYASGNSSCGQFIGQCGCAITSAVMLMRYYEIETAVDGLDVNPKNINNWLKSLTNKGYSAGNLTWSKVQEYSENSSGLARLRFDGVRSFKDTDTLDSYLTAGSPVIAQNILNGHFLVIDSKLGDLYGVKDPRWYETRYLTQNVINTNLERNYNNHFDGLRLYTHISIGIDVPSSIAISLASPAELLITAPDGKRLGKDPISNIEYNEIPDGVYYEDGISDPEQAPTEYHKIKNLWVPSPISGSYDIEVIGTGEGGYTVDSNIYDFAGASHFSTFTGNTEEGVITGYSLEYDSEDPENIIVEPVDQTPPTTTISLDGTLGTNDWYISDVEVTLDAFDNEDGVGVWQTEYSFDGGTTWSVYTEPFILSDEGIHEILYRSEDYIGNIESEKSETIKIDKTNPEANIFFDTTINKINVTGTDNLTIPTVAHTPPYLYSITDGAGLNTTIELEGTIVFNPLSDIYTFSGEITSLQYNNNPTVIQENSITYSWQSLLGNTILLSQNIDVEDQFRITASYNSITDTTDIIIQDEDGINTDTVSGTAIIILKTSQGILEYEY